MTKGWMYGNRVFEGKDYLVHGTHHYKSEATKMARDVRKRGGLARILKKRTGQFPYIVYARFIYD